MDKRLVMGEGSCDILFHQDSSTLRNERGEVVAYFSEGEWVPLQENFCSTYCKDLQFAILTTIASYKGGLDISPLLRDLQKRFTEIKKNKVKTKSILKDVSIALDVSNEEVLAIQSKIGRILSNQKMKYQKIKNPHVSTAYLIGEYDYEYLVTTLKLLSNLEFKFKASKIEVLEGATTKRDYVVLLLEPDESFLKAIKIIEQESDIIKFAEGFKTHISLFSVETKSLSHEKIISMNDVLMGKDIELTHVMNIKPKAISLFNKDRLLELRQKLRSKL